jgi:hypothetical protein
MFDLPFGSALPLGLAAWLLRRRGRSRPMGKLYSHDELAAKLRAPALAEVRSYWAVPEMRYPAQYVRSDAGSVSVARAQPGFRAGQGRKVNVLMRLMPAAWVRHFMPGLAFLAFKTPDRR